ncbi:Tetraspanin/Peripherin [Macleaya cordata]|uniref:Tetraspanin/Peripherin n=1 Tax=Macleaya cordata TaxID=56857 RepID=A0A200QLI3_MACCD|nr:Tetraspanin/Peripherin [Macleaya cordata]
MHFKGAAQPVPVKTCNESELRQSQNNWSCPPTIIGVGVSMGTKIFRTEPVPKPFTAVLGPHFVDSVNFRSILDLPILDPFNFGSTQRALGWADLVIKLAMDTGTNLRFDLALLNFIALLCSIPIIGSGIWLSSKPDNECIRLFRWPILFLGILILLVSLAGFVGAYWNRPALLACHLFCMAILIVILLFVLVFAFVITKPDGSYQVPGRGYKEYRIDGFSTWLQNYVKNGGHWRKIQNCLSVSNVCSKLGCCKPPTACGFGYVNPTLWVNPANPTADFDCYTWSNDQSQLCYGCNSCKAGLLGNLRMEWRKANVILIVAVVILIWVYVIACCAFKNAQTEDLFNRYKQGWV